MSSSGERTHLRLLTVGDFDPQTDQAIEANFIGRVIAGRYTVRAHIGGGGMADVFRATDEELGIDVAIKLLKPRMASDELRARMVQEARAAAQVRHDNLVRVFGTGKLDSTAYIVMELLDGPNLEQYVREYRHQRIPWREALTLLLPALEALHAIHERGYVHRDIKTGNILVTREPGRPPTAIVIDLGLVKPDRALRCATNLPTTEVGRMLCTPGYTSPEQAAGLPVDRRSDVYSMAVTLYRVLAGRLPFHDARGQPVAVVLAKHIYNEPTMLAEAAAGADIPPAIASVIESALRKSPNDRPQTMLAFAEALRTAAASAATSAVPRHHRPHELLLALGLGIVVTWLALPRPAAINLPTGQVFPTAASKAGDMNPSARGDIAVVTPTPLTADNIEIPVTTPAAPAAPAMDGSAAEVSEAPSVTSPQPSLSAAALASRATPGPGSPPEPPRRRPDPQTAWHRALERRTADVQRCADKATGSFERLAVTVNIGSDARVSAHVAGAADMPLSRCLDKALRPTPLTAPREPASFVHVFKLRTTPPRRP
jgi:serine/threonine-protein kinase